MTVHRSLISYAFKHALFWKIHPNLSSIPSNASCRGSLPQQLSLPSLEGIGGCVSLPFSCVCVCFPRKPPDVARCSRSTFSPFPTGKYKYNSIFIAPSALPVARYRETQPSVWGPGLDGVFRFFSARKLTFGVAHATILAGCTLLEWLPHFSVV